MKINYFLGTCQSLEIAQLAEKKGRKASYNKAKKAIKEYDPDMYDYLALDFPNPWDHCTNIKKGNILHIVHSAIDYLFLLY